MAPGECMSQALVVTLILQCMALDNEKKNVLINIMGLP